VVEVFKPTTRRKRADAGGDRDVVVQQWPVLGTDARVQPDRMMNGVLKQQRLQDLRAVELPVVQVHSRLYLAFDLRVECRVEEKYAGIHKIRLTLKQARAHGGHQTVRPEQEQPGASQRNRLAVQKVGAAARKRVVQQAAVRKRRVAQESSAGELL